MAQGIQPNQSNSAAIQCRHHAVFLPGNQTRENAGIYLDSGDWHWPWTNQFVTINANTNTKQNKTNQPIKLTNIQLNSTTYRPCNVTYKRFKMPKLSKMLHQSIVWLLHIQHWSFISLAIIIVFLFTRLFRKGIVTAQPTLVSSNDLSDQDS